MKLQTLPFSLGEYVSSMAVAQGKGAEAGNILPSSLGHGAGVAYVSAVCHCVKQSRQMDNRMVRHHIRSYPGRNLIMTRHYAPSHFSHYL